MFLNNAVKMLSANGRTSACVNLYRQPGSLHQNPLWLLVDFDEKDAFYRYGGISENDVIVGCEVLYKNRENRNELVFGELVAVVR